jgi:uncharacterized protein YbjT (DUF2867 family)
MRIFLAGATGVVGQHLVPLLVAGGHHVTATTRKPEKLERLRAQGAEPVVVDGLDRDAVMKAVVAAQRSMHAGVMALPGPLADRPPV